MFVPPVTSHIGVIEYSLVVSAITPACLSKPWGLPGNLRSKEKRRWSQRNGSLVSSSPGVLGVIGNSNYKEILHTHSRYILLK